MTNERTLTDADVQALGVAIAMTIAKPKKRHGQVLRLLRALVSSSSNYTGCIRQHGVDSVMTSVALTRLDADLDTAAHFLSDLERDGGST